MDLAKVVSTRATYQWNEGSLGDGRQKNPIRAHQRLHVVAYDFGIKRNILRLLADQGCRVTVLPAQATAREALALKPDGVFLSNGPGDPEPCDYAIAAIQQLLETDVPIFGICLGHQLLGLASGARTVKMKFGHHGANHPVQDLETGRVLITSQNHGFAVDEATLPANLAHASFAVRRLAAGRGAHRPHGFQLPGAPRGEPRPARRAAAVRAVSPRRCSSACSRSRKRATPRKTSNRPRKDMPKAHRHQEHPDHRRRPDRHRPGLRVRLLRSPGLQGAARGGLPRHPRELESGDDHDRPGDGRRHLHRAGQLAHGRAHHREGAPRRAAAHHGRPDRAEHRALAQQEDDRSSPTRACWRSSASS